MYRFKSSLIVAVFAIVALSFAGSAQALTIYVGAGTYTEDIVIPADKTGLELVGASGAIIQGVAIGPEAEFPLAAPNIEILADGVKIHGFTIKSPVYVAGNYSSGIVIGGQNVEIYDNQFQVWAGETTGEIAQAIQTYHESAMPGVNVSGLNIHDNTFVNLNTPGIWGYEAIYINRDTAGGSTVTVQDNIFNGNVLRAITAERSNVVITGNVITTALIPTDADLITAGGYEGISIRDVGSGGPIAQDNVSVTNNIVRGLTPTEGFLQGIRIGLTAQTFTNISVTGNIVDGSSVGVLIKISTAMGVTFTGNNIGNSNTIGVQNDDTVNAFLADGNYWTSYAGPGVSDGFRTGATALGAGTVTVNSWSMGEFGVDVGETTPDSINNDSDPDDDNDTFTDLQELAAGTDQLNADNFPPAITAISVWGGWSEFAIGADVVPLNVITNLPEGKIAPANGKVGFDCFATWKDAIAAAPLVTP